VNGDILLDSHEFTKDEYGGKITFMRESNKQNSLLQEEELFSLAKQIKQGFSEPLSESVLSSRENSAVLEYALWVFCSMMISLDILSIPFRVFFSELASQLMEGISAQEPTYIPSSFDHITLYV